MGRLITYLEFESILRFEDPVQLQVESYVSNKQF
jgi:hypothetical protein